MTSAGQRVVYTARCAQAEAALALLRDHDLHPAVADTTSVAMPWIGGGLDQVTVVVPEPEAQRAQTLIAGFEARHVIQAERGAGRIGPQLLLATAFFVGGTWAGLVSATSTDPLGMVALACWLAGLALFVRLVRRGRHVSVHRPRH